VDIRTRRGPAEEGKGPEARGIKPEHKGARRPVTGIDAPWNVVGFRWLWVGVLVRGVAEANGSTITQARTFCCAYVPPLCPLVPSVSAFSPFSYSPPPTRTHPWACSRLSHPHLCYHPFTLSPRALCLEVIESAPDGQIHQDIYQVVLRAKQFSRARENRRGNPCGRVRADRGGGIRDLQRSWWCFTPEAGELDDARTGTIRRGHPRRSTAPRHVPDEIIAVQPSPDTRTGKKLEDPVERILPGRRSAPGHGRG